MKGTHVILDRLVDPVVRILTPSVSRALLGLKADRRTQARMDALARMCDRGALSGAEREEYETSVRFANYLAILQAKARRRLARHERS